MDGGHLETVVEHTEPLEDTTSAEQFEVQPQQHSKITPLLDSAHADTSTQSKEDMTFDAKIALYQQELDDEFRAYEESLFSKQRDNELEDLDWDTLVDRYEREMSLQVANEQDVIHDFSVRFQQFALWMQVSNEKEAERSIKRLKTRAAFVQNSESKLATKQEHYAKVLGAFQGAMALLSNL